MKIGINASFARKADVGMGQVSINFLKTLAKKCDSNDVFNVYLEEDTDIKFPKNFNKRIIKSFYKRDDLIRKIIWEKFLLPWAVKKDGCEKFFSLYQSPTIIKNIPHIMLVHDSIVKIFPWYLNNWRKKFYYSQVDRGVLNASKIMTVSDHSKLDIVRLYKIPGDNIVVNKIDCDPIFKKRPLKKEILRVLKKFNLDTEEYIFYIGGFDMRKDVGNLIRSFASYWNDLRDKRDCPRLALAGKFSPHLVPLVTNIEEEIDNVTEKYGIPRRKFKKLGFVDQKDLPALYHGASAFCFSSLYEGFGLPVLEAFNCGCPVVSSDNSSLKELVNKKNAFVFDLDKNDLDKKLHDCMSQKKKRKTKVEQAKKDAKNFSWENFTKKTLEELEKMKK